MDEEEIKITVSDDGGITFKSGEPEKDKRFKVDKKSLMKFAGIFLGIIILVVGIIYAWKNYLSSDARDARNMANQYQKYLDWETQYRETLKNDTFGGSTPEATLKLFVEALKKGDVDLASKYFWIDESQKMKNGLVDLLNKTKNENNLLRFATDLEKFSESEKISENRHAFIYKDGNGIIELQLLLKLNEQAKIWKIENM